MDDRSKLEKLKNAVPALAPAIDKKLEQMRGPVKKEEVKPKRRRRK